jgi:hypothetical protein
MTYCTIIRVSCDDAILQLPRGKLHRVRYVTLQDNRMDLQAEAESLYAAMARSIDPRILYRTKTTTTDLRRYPVFQRAESSFLLSLLHIARQSSDIKREEHIRLYDRTQWEANAVRKELRASLRRRKKSEPSTVLAQEHIPAMLRDRHYLRCSERMPLEVALRQLYGFWNEMRDESVVHGFAGIHDAPREERRELMQYMQRVLRTDRA